MVRFVIFYVYAFGFTYGFAGVSEIRNNAKRVIVVCFKREKNNGCKNIIQ